MFRPYPILQLFLWQSKAIAPVMPFPPNYPLANEVAKEYSYATFRPSIRPSVLL
jgi:hypothetical protein